MFLQNFFNIARFHEKTANRSAEIKNICPGGKGCVHPPFLHLWTKGIVKWETEPLIILSNY